eukprot:CAMPEP_0194765296 /NCGR_PEP_ID=MMETSP0323_2-20130528/25911_1 /TAXON_ID=2866 ORGANISM="Crypthecodinium cohnii, Strain Seligo" /NCGR_SAMPLE_ID=MMETSP0323_2 /ASSEMBLY_ACC=CAM_ASM_000346 /LENGTH=56 /DNA_ID=CAMNT_0039694463 /DNA_START=59 /DNA_END=225 /DNA_ORIENTATION=-
MARLDLQSSRDVSDTAMQWLEMDSRAAPKRQHEGTARICPRRLRVVSSSATSTIFT